MASAFDLCSLSWADRQGYVSIATRDPKLGKDDVGYWHDDIFNWPRDKDEIRAAIANASSSAKDVYFSPEVFTKPRRSGKVAGPTDMLWADLDEVDPHKLPDNLKPTAAWETSPGRYQALWKMDTELGPQAQSQLNQRLTYAIGADKGGWDLGQVLRIPGTHNHKYPNSPRVKLNWLNGHVLDTRRVMLDLPDTETLAPETNVNEDLPSPKDVLKQYRMNARARVLIRSRHAQKGQRSDRLWELACLLAEAGAERAEIVAVTRSTVWNKFEGRHDELQRLFAEADKAIAHVPRPERTELTDGITTDEVVNVVDQELGPVAWRDFDREHEPISWLVADVWGESEVGFISGLPKSYKSWIALDLAVSVATGNRFLDAFQTHKHNVLLIQEEDPKFVLQDRLVKIAAQKGLIELDIATDHTSFEMRYHLPENLFIISNQGFTINEDWLDMLKDWITERHIELIILDPLMMMGEGFDEFKAFEMMQTILKPLKRLRATTGTAIAVVHHHFKGSATGGAKDMYGSVALWAWEEAALHLTVQGQGTVVAERFSKHSLLPPITVEIGNVEEHWNPIVSSGGGTKTLVDHVASTGGSTTEELSEVSGVKRDAILRQLKKLEEQGRIKRARAPGQGPGRNKTMWVVA